jgi:hypothetical protein
MVQNKKEETSTLNYDERNKILLQKKSNIIEHKTEEVKEGEEVTESKLISTVKSSMEVEYTEEGIRLAYNGLSEEKKHHDKHLIDLNNGLKDAREMTPELEKLKEDLQTLGKIEQAEKSKKEIEATEERLIVVNKEIKEIQDEIGTRLKL